MAAVTQQIPNYLLGISEQPDELKSPGQVVDLKNGLPDITRGLVKRPGGQFVGAITPNSGTKKWFSMYTDEDNQYIGQVDTNGEIKVWAVKTLKWNTSTNKADIPVEGVEIPVDYSGVPGTNKCTYLSGWTNQEEIQDLTLNESTFLVNRNDTVIMTNDKTPDYVHEAIIELKALSPSKQYAINIHDPTSNAEITETRATAVEADEHSSHGKWWGGSSDAGKCSKQGRAAITPTSSGSGYTSRDGKRSNLRVEMDFRCVPIVDPNDTSSPKDDYISSYQPYPTLQFGGEGWQTDHTVELYKEDGIAAQVKIKNHVTIKSRASIAAVRPPATASRADEAITASGILGDIKNDLDNNLSGHGITSTIIGNCIHLHRSSAFSVNTPEQTLMSIVTAETNSVADLPTTCRHGMVVKVVNSAEDDDDFYLKFKANNNDIGTNEDWANRRFGKGVWVECAKPDLKTTLDADSLPVKLQRGLPDASNLLGNFAVTKPTWLTRDVGDDTTNPEPSFVGQKINKLLFFRNRLVILSGDKLVASVSNQFFKFWSKTAMTTTASDPIDLLCGSTYPTQLYDGIEVNTGLLLFSSSQQFMLTTDSDEFSPETAKINFLCSYNFDHKTVPFTLGTTAGFINSTGNNARFYEMDQIRREGEPTLLEQSKVVSKLFPLGINMPISSKENGILFFGERDSSEVWGYRYFNSGQKRALSSWFRWELPGKVVYHTILDDVYYTVLNTGTSFNIEGFDIKTQTDTTTVGTTPNVFDVHLDSHQNIAASALSYSAATGKTSVATPAGFIHTGKQLAVYVNKNTTGGSSENLGRFALASVNGGNIEWDRDWTAGDLVLGYVFDWEVEIPTIYRQQQTAEKVKTDTTASLMIQRMHFSFGAVGYISSTLERIGRVDYTDNYESLEWDKYLSNTVGIRRMQLPQKMHTIPAYERNTNLTVKLKSSHPSPATLYSMTWEGDYNNRYYQRV